MKIRPMLLALTVAFPATVSAQIPVNQLPLTVRKAVTGLDNDCRNFGGKPGNSPDMLRSADLNGDGVRDYVTDLNNYRCDGAASAMGSGQSGAAVTVYVGGPTNSAIQVWAGTVHASKIETTAGKSRLWVDVAGGSCGQRNADRIPFANWQFCSRELVWNAKKQTFDFAPLAQRRRIQ